MAVLSGGIVSITVVVHGCVQSGGGRMVVAWPGVLPSPVVVSVVTTSDGGRSVAVQASGLNLANEMSACCFP